MGHLRKHPAAYKTYEDDRAAATDQQQSTSGTRPTSSKQITLEESQCRSKVWDINDSRTLCVTTKIGEMIAVDCHPFSIVDDPDKISASLSVSAVLVKKYRHICISGNLCIGATLINYS